MRTTTARADTQCPDLPANVVHADEENAWRAVVMLCALSLTRAFAARSMGDIEFSLQGDWEAATIHPAELRQLGNYAASVGAL